jgi:acyl-CoA-binding protein
LGKEQQKSFYEMKQKVSQETLLAFPDIEKNFMYTDASNKKLGAFIMQEEKYLAFYSIKLSSAQTRYTTGEQEILSIVETLKARRDILLGQHVIVHTDHLNMSYGKLSNNDRITR